MSSAYRPEFEAALRLFARVSGAMAARGFGRPILVGGAAAELYTTSAITTGDFDICTPYQPEFEAELQREGLVKPGGPHSQTRGFVHPVLGLGFEVVAATPMDGGARVRLIEQAGETGPIRVVSVEDLIADRMGQYASGTARDRLDQARKLFALNPDCDLAYLDRRIREESMGDHGLEDVRA
jgi:hypothetical protein